MSTRSRAASLHNNGSATEFTLSTGVCEPRNPIALNPDSVNSLEDSRRRLLAVEDLSL